MGHLLKARKKILTQVGFLSLERVRSTLTSVQQLPNFFIVLRISGCLSFCAVLVFLVFLRRCPVLYYIQANAKCRHAHLPCGKSPRVCLVPCRVYTLGLPVTKPGCFGHTRVCTRVPILVVLVILGYVSGYHTWLFWSYLGVYPGIPQGFDHTRVCTRVPPGVYTLLNPPLESCETL